jgi:DNA modification methylase
MRLHLSAPEFDLWHGDCIEVMRGLPDASVDAVVTDPPYGLEFMGKDWDAPWKQSGDVVGDPASVGGFQDGNGGNPFSRSRIRFGTGEGFQQWCEQWATECLRVLKPGGHLLAFGGTRTWHRLACAIEDAGFEMRDSIAWMYGSGFPKSLDVSKAIDKAAGFQGRVIGRGTSWNRPDSVAGDTARMNISPGEYDIKELSDGARQWQGWGTALKPAFEPIVVARKPLIGTVAANVLTHGTGALNIDGCRIDAIDKAKFPVGLVSETEAVYGGGEGRYAERPRGADSFPAGRWPANVILDESQAAELGDEARFFYTAKANSNERPNVEGTGHPTVKPLELMRYLVRLVTPPGGTVLEPFGGSGTTIEACVIEGFHCIAIELTEEYLTLIAQRLTKPIQVALL